MRSMSGTGIASGAPNRRHERDHLRELVDARRREAPARAERAQERRHVEAASRSRGPSGCRGSWRSRRRRARRAAIAQARARRSASASSQLASREALAVADQRRAQPVGILLQTLQAVAPWGRGSRARARPRRRRGSCARPRPRPRRRGRSGPRTGCRCGRRRSRRRRGSTPPRFLPIRQRYNAAGARARGDPGGRLAPGPRLPDARGRGGPHATASPARVRLRPRRPRRRLREPARRHRRGPALLRAEDEGPHGSRTSTPRTPSSARGSSPRPATRSSRT